MKAEESPGLNAFPAAEYAAGLVNDMFMLEQMNQLRPELAELNFIAQGFNLVQTAELSAISTTETSSRLAAARESYSAGTNAEAISKAIEARDLPVMGRENKKTNLTASEMLVLVLAKYGKRIEETAEKLEVSEQSIKDFRRGIFKKLHAYNISHAMYEAYRLGLFPIPDEE